MPFAPRERMREWWDCLTGEQKFAVGVFAVFGTATLVLSYQFVRLQIQAPFTATIASVQGQDRTFLEDEESVAKKERARDTDQDGLNDYLEKNTYRTSIYLRDTDSDGIPDAIEVARGSDPLCPEGKPCALPLNVDGVATYTTSSAMLQDLVQTRDVPFIESAMGGGSSTQGALDFLSSPPDPSTMNAAQVRAYLVENNLVRADQIQGVSDADILSIYRSSYNEVVRSQATPNAVSTPALPTP